MINKQYEILALTLRYWIVFLIGIIFWQSFKDTWKVLWRRSKITARRTGNIPFLLILLVITAFGLLSLKSSGTIDTLVLILGILIIAVILFQYYLVKYIFKGADRFFLLIVDTLAVLGFIMLQRLNPQTGFRQVEWFAIGSGFMIMCIVGVQYIKSDKWLVYISMGVSFILLLAALLFGKRMGGAKNWFTIGRYSIQPSEFVKMLLIYIFAADFIKEKNFIKRLPVFIFSALSVVLVVLQRDLGAALIYFCIFVMMYNIATSDWFITIASLGAGTLGAILSYHIFSHVRVRVETWKNPWAAIEDKGYQIAQALIAIGSGGLVGAGLGLGIPNVIPASQTDFIFAAICEEMGILVGLMVIGFYAVITIRGVIISLNAIEPFDAMLSMGATIAISIQSFIIIGGVIKLIPLTGVTMPFVSYGGSSMMASLGLVGIIEGVAIKTGRLRRKMDRKHKKEDYEEDYFDDDVDGESVDEWEDMEQ